MTTYEHYVLPPEVVDPHIESVVREIEEQRIP